jgi:hypothetical protein
MAERRTYNLAYGKRYTAQDRTEKKVWIPVGKLYIDPETEYGESIRVRIDALPTDPNFSGVLTAFPSEPRNGQGKGNNENLDEIPF